MKNAVIIRAFTAASVFLLTLLLATIVLADIIGYVYDENGNPLEGAWITTSGVVSVQTNSSGFFNQKAAAGTYTVTASMPGFVSQTKNNVGSSSNPSPNNFVLPLALSASPNLGLTGGAGGISDVTIRGSGFDGATRVSLAYDLDNKSSVISEVDLPADQSASAGTLVGNTLYMMDYFYDSGVYSNCTFRVVDVSDPAYPRTVGSTATTMCSASKIVVIDNLAYVSGGSGFEIIDVGEPSSPGSIRHVSMPNSSNYGLAVRGGYAYTTYSKFNGVDWDYGLRIIDVSPAASAYLAGYVLTPGTADDVTVAGDYLYFADGKAGLRVYDVGTNPKNPIFKKTLPAPGYTGTASYSGYKRVSVAGDYLYVTASLFGLKIFDIRSTPSSPIYLGGVDTPIEAHGIDVEGDVAYVGDWSTVQVIDITDKAKPEILGFVGTTAFDVSVSGNIALVAGGVIIDVSNYTDLSQIYEYTAGSAYDVAVDDGYAYVADGENGLQIFNLNAKGGPQLVGSVDTDGIARAVAVHGDYAYIADEGNGFQAINVANPYAPSKAYRVVTANDAMDVVVDWPYAYVAVHYAGVERIDLVDKESDGAIDTSGSAQGVAIVGNTLLVADHTAGIWMADLGTGVITTIPITGSSHYALKAVMIGDYIYVADFAGGLQIRNKSDGTFTSEVDVPGWAMDVVVVGSNAYVAYTDPFNDSGIQVVDVSVPSDPKTIGRISVPGTAIGITEVSGSMYVADQHGLLTLAPFSDYFKELSVSVNSSTRLTASGFKRDLTGNYNLGLVSGSGDEEQLNGALTFTANAALFNAKAIIVAGGGPDASGDIWQQTMDYANQAYATLKYQGYTDLQIRYLTDQSDAPGRDGPANRVGLQNAVTWAKSGSTSSLIVYLVDHGEDERFQVRGGSAPEYVSAGELDGWLDSFQSVTSAKILFMYDACKAGSFLGRMVPSQGQARVNITSASADQSAYFLTENGSFSSHFWSVLSGKAGERVDILSAWNRASSTMGLYQEAQLEANGNGLTNETEDLETLKAIDFPMGRQWSDDKQRRPEITSIVEDKVLYGNTNSVLKASEPFDYDKDVIVRVWAEILPPDMEPPSGDLTVTSGIEVDLVELNTVGLYEANYTGFSAKGTYVVTYYAMDADGLVSLPKTSLVKQNAGTNTPSPDVYEPDNSGSQAQVINVNAFSGQSHTFHAQGDEDWVKFYGIAGETYEIKADNPSPVNDPVIQLYGPNSHSSMQTSRNSFGAGWKEVLNWICPADGFYYVRVTNASGIYGNNVYYNLKVYKPEALEFPGYVRGRITSGGKGVSGAVVRAGKGTAITLADGSFVLCLNPGSYSVSVSCSGYQSTSFSLNLSTGQSVSLSRDMNSIPRIINSPPPVIKANELYSYTPVVADADGDPLTFSISGKPGWASFSTANGSLWGRPSAAHEGIHGPITIKVTDNSGASDSVVFKIIVSKGAAGALPGVFLLLQK